jgi:maltose alpha-D-glucosyltransferase/alpha-amylase
MRSSVRLEPEQMIAAMGLSGLASKRWFRQKLAATGELSVEVEDWAELPCPGSPQPLLMTVVRTGLGDRYFVPVGARAHTTAGDTGDFDLIGQVAPSLELFDAAASADYVHAVVSLIEAGAAVPSLRGLLRFEPASAVPTSAPPPAWSVRPQGGAYSNSVVFAERRIVLKTFRGFSGGVNPEAEIGQALAGVAGFSDVAPFIGHVVYERPEGDRESVAVVTAEVPSQGDAWELTVASLTSAATNGAGRKIDMEGLGRAIARLHVALASVERPGFGRRQVGCDDLTAWIHAYERHAQDACRALGAFYDMSGKCLDVPEAVLASPLSRYMGSDPVMGSAIRCHGDLHLGQVLVRSDGGFSIIDFEGEPSAPVSARKALTSPARDLAGMARSLSYARAVAERANGVSLAAWEREARETLFRGYDAELAERGIELLPPRPMRTALIAHFETEKALYELVYELNNRPDWMEIPLAGLWAMGGALGGEQT